MLADVKVDDFEMQWAAIVEECGVSEVDWVKDLYAKRNSGQPLTFVDAFTPDCKPLLDRCVNFLRDNEDEMDFRSFYETPVLETDFLELGKSATSEYTRAIFFRFRETLKGIVRISILEREEMSDRDRYI
ncbi:hypothetical protein PIB30_043997 [Stylosanthes scabra]|uniref:Uncharacterized protein n=1 Tax=Stylosanthes scabra TaxID=79078 RepID=A0ABU6VF86_9FABA|nr:hypothetical protein [Stylosanthes scabra]